MRQFHVELLEIMEEAGTNVYNYRIHSMEARIYRRIGKGYMSRI
ncbi:MAG: hypothetical protein K0S61_3480 [Anaerocolumna sp.]|jgi:hypothetical protein|nr:hypothetical protein [Anaerocolumna sp.]